MLIKHVAYIRSNRPARSLYAQACVGDVVVRLQIGRIIHSARFAKWLSGGGIRVHRDVPIKLLRLTTVPLIVEVDKSHTLTGD